MNNEPMTLLNGSHEPCGGCGCKIMEPHSARCFKASAPCASTEPTPSDTELLDWLEQDMRSGRDDLNTVFRYFDLRLESVTSTGDVSRLGSPTLRGAIIAAIAQKEQGQRATKYTFPFNGEIIHSVVSKSCYRRRILDGYTPERAATEPPDTPRHGGQRTARVLGGNPYRRWAS